VIPGDGAGIPLEPGPADLEALLGSASALVTRLAGTDVAGGAGDPGPPGPGPRALDDLFAVFRDAVADAADTTGPRAFAYFPGGGLVSSAVAEMVSRTANRYTGTAATARRLVALEDEAVRWFAGALGLPPGAGGLVTTGASTGTLSALVAAREQVLGPPPAVGTVYVTEHTHHCVARAAHVTGIPADHVRRVPVTADRRMDPEAADRMIREDVARGRRPLLLATSAGSTDTGTVDDLTALGAVARRHGLWWHVDAAYGGGFALTERGRRRLAGIGDADSVTVDAHKSLFLPYSTGLLLVREPRVLRTAHAADPVYLQDLPRDDDLPEYGEMGVELSREYRGLRLWLPWHLHGVDAFREALDEKLDLSARLHRRLRALPGVDAPAPDLTVHTLRLHAGDAATRRVHDAVTAGGRFTLSTTRIDGRLAVRCCVLNHRTHAEHVDELADALSAAVLAEVGDVRTAA
jgi:aromatic-L-amino-acid/L-tryptophan decarboxylase